MNIAEPFIRRPVATTLIMLAVLLFGTMAYRGLPVSDLPNVDFPTLLVTASLPGSLRANTPVPNAPVCGSMGTTVLPTGNPAVLGIEA